MVVLKPGDKVGEYILEARLGRGTFGEVWRGRHHLIGTLAAVKVPTDPDYIRNLRTEARIQGKVENPHIVRTLAGDPSADPPFIVMEYVDGESLRDVLKDGKPLAVETAVNYARQILDALAAAHAAGVIHRDLKPENILIDRTGLLKITDFGLGRVQESTASSIRQSGSLVSAEGKSIAGTWEYMAPEQKEPGETVDHRADLYAFGIILFEMLTGIRPTGLDLPSETHWDVPKHLDLVFRNCYCSVHRRYRTPSEVLAALDIPVERVSASVRSPLPSGHSQGTAARSTGERARAPLSRARGIGRLRRVVRLTLTTAVIAVITIVIGALIDAVRRSNDRNTAIVLVEEGQIAVAVNRVSGYAVDSWPRRSVVEAARRRVQRAIDGNEVGVLNEARTALPEDQEVHRLFESGYPKVRAQHLRVAEQYAAKGRVSEVADVAGRYPGDPAFARFLSSAQRVLNDREATRIHAVEGDLGKMNEAFARHADNPDFLAPWRSGDDDLGYSVYKSNDIRSFMRANVGKPVSISTQVKKVDRVEVDETPKVTKMRIEVTPVGGGDEFYVWVYPGSDFCPGDNVSILRVGQEVTVWGAVERVRAGGWSGFATVPTWNISPLRFWSPGRYRRLCDIVQDFHTSSGATSDAERAAARQRLDQWFARGLWADRIVALALVAKGEVLAAFTAISHHPAKSPTRDSVLAATYERLRSAITNNEMRVLNEAKAALPDDLEVQRLLGVAYPKIRAHDLEVAEQHAGNGAVKDLEEAVGRYPGDPEFAGLLARAKAMRQDQEAICGHAVKGDLANIRGVFARHRANAGFLSPWRSGDDDLGFLVFKFGDVGSFMRENAGKAVNISAKVKKVDKVEVVGPPKIEKMRVELTPVSGSGEFYVWLVLGSDCCPDDKAAIMQVGQEVTTWGAVERIGSDWPKLVKGPTWNISPLHFWSPGRYRRLCDMVQDAQAFSDAISDSERTSARQRLGEWFGEGMNLLKAQGQSPQSRQGVPSRPAPST